MISPISMDVANRAGSAKPRLPARLLNESEPSLVAADEVGGACQSQVVQPRRNEARAIPLVAHDHDPHVVANDLRDSMRGSGIEAPFQNVSVDHNRAGHQAIARTLLDRASVDDQGSVTVLAFEIRRRDSVEPTPCIREQLIDRAPWTRFVHPNANSTPLEAHGRLVDVGGDVARVTSLQFIAVTYERLSGCAVEGGWRGRAVSFEDFVHDVVNVVEATGAAIMVLGALWVLAAYGVAVSQEVSRAGAYHQLRRSLGKVILVGLEILIVGDIIRTIVVDPTFESVSVLGLIVIIRIVLSIALELEVEGIWPWQRWRLEQPSAVPDRTG